MTYIAYERIIVRCMAENRFSIGGSVEARLTDVYEGARSLMRMARHSDQYPRRTVQLYGIAALNACGILARQVPDLVGGAFEPLPFSNLELSLVAILERDRQDDSSRTAGADRSTDSWPAAAVGRRIILELSVGSRPGWRSAVEAYERVDASHRA